MTPFRPSSASFTAAAPRRYAWSRSTREAMWRAAQPLGHGDRAPADPLDRFLHPGEDPRFVEGDLGKEQDLRRAVRRVRGEPAGRGNPARMPPHHLEDEDL